MYVNALQPMQCARRVLSSAAVLPPAWTGQLPLPLHVEGFARVLRVVTLHGHHSLKEGYIGIIQGSFFRASRLHIRPFGPCTTCSMVEMVETVETGME